MNDRHAGDIKDFLKYALLRRLHQCCDFSIGVCWMKTPWLNPPVTPRNEDRKYSYLQKDHWRFLDKDLFSWLQEFIIKQNRVSVREFQKAGFIPAKLFYGKDLPTGVEERDVYFENFLRESEECDLLFFDPDTGLDPNPDATTPSRTHLSYFETFLAHAADKFVLIFQDPSYKNRNSLIQTTMDNLREYIRGVRVIAYETPHVVFFLLLPLQQGQHIKAVDLMNDLMEEDWNQERSPSGATILRVHKSYEM